MTLEDCVKEFCKVFRLRKEGKLPSPDLSTFCEICGKEISPGQSIDFTEKGITCRDCQLAKKQ